VYIRIGVALANLQHLGLSIWLCHFDLIVDPRVARGRAAEDHLGQARSCDIQDLRHLGETDGPYCKQEKSKTA